MTLRERRQILGIRRLKKTIFREYTTSQSNRCRSCRSRGSNQSPNELLKFDAGSELRSVGLNFIGITPVIVVVIEIAEAEFGIDVDADPDPRIRLEPPGRESPQARDLDVPGIFSVFSPVQSLQFSLFLEAVFRG